MKLYYLELAGLSFGCEEIDIINFEKVGTRKSSRRSERKSSYNSDSFLSERETIPNTILAIGEGVEYQLVFYIESLVLLLNLQ